MWYHLTMKLYQKALFFITSIVIYLMVAIFGSIFLNYLIEMFTFSSIIKVACTLGYVLIIATVISYLIVNKIYDRALIKKEVAEKEESEG